LKKIYLKIYVAYPINPGLFVWTLPLQMIEPIYYQILDYYPEIDNTTETVQILGDEFLLKP